MKVRFEQRGIHFYDRVTGVHILADECCVPERLCSQAPSVVSIALTNVCDLNCDFCYAPKDEHSLDKDAVLDWCRELDSLGTLEVALGGGEPTLYRGLADLCHRIWEDTNLGISVTTNGHHLTPSLISQLVGTVSIIRISIDSVEPLYAKLRGRPLTPVLNAISYLAGQVPVGINTVINSFTLSTMNQMLQFVKEAGVIDWLLLPQVHNGGFVLSANDWRRLEKWINDHWAKVDLSITAEAQEFIKCPFLFTSEDQNDYAHISADYYLRKCSYELGGISMRGRTFREGLQDLNKSFEVSSATESTTQSVFA